MLVAVLIGTWVWWASPTSSTPSWTVSWIRSTAWVTCPRCSSTAQPTTDAPSRTAAWFAHRRIAGLTLSVPSDVVLPQLGNGLRL